MKNKKSLSTILVVLLLAAAAYFGNQGGKPAPKPTQVPQPAAPAIVLPTAAATQNAQAPKETKAAQTPKQEAPAIREDGAYTGKDEVALYLHTFGHLPDNFITTAQARDLGWTGGSLEDYAPGKSIGGDRFGNFEGLLPEKRGRTYYECDIDTLNRSSRGAKRIVFSNDGLIYYTDDHYESFELLYGE